MKTIALSFVFIALFSFFLPHRIFSQVENHSNKLPDELTTRPYVDLPDALAAITPELQIAESPGKNPEVGEQFTTALLGKCDVFTNVFCGTTLNNQSTVGAGNDFVLADYPGLSTSSSFAGADLLYRLQIIAKTNVQIVMNITTSGVDLDMFLLTNCSVPTLKSYTGEPNASSGIYKEIIDVNLDPGFYFLVVDGYNSAQQGSFSLSVDCVSTAIEPTTDLSSAYKYWADDCENYNNNTNLDPQSNRWRRWDSTTADGDAESGHGRVETASGNKYARFTYANPAPDMIYELNEGNVPSSNQPITSGRWRMSWKMKIQTGKKGYFNVLHQKPDNNGDNAVWAYDVYLSRNAAGDGQLVLSNSSLTFANFNNPVGLWFNVVNIIDLAKDSAELWINNSFVASWKFSTATGGGSLNQLDGINFYAGGTTSDDFLVDSLCIWRQPPSINCNDQPLGDLVCLASGKKYNGPAVAGCQLYSSFEYYPCESICDYGGTFIYRGQPRSGHFDYSDRAPGQLRNMQCVKDAYNDNVPQDLYADIYIFYHLDRPNFAALSWGNPPNNNVRVFIMKCHTLFSSGNPNKNTAINITADTCIYFATCIDECAPNASTFLYSLPWVDNSKCDDFYYIVVTGTYGEVYSDISIVPGDICPDNVSALQCGTQQQFGVTEYIPLQSDQYFSSSWPFGNAYPCYNGARSYNGGEAFYKFEIDHPKKITITLQANEPMGVFLYSFLCGRDCIQYAGTLPGTGTATLNATLENGTYYLVVDKDVSGGDESFLISLDCEYIPLFDPNIIKVVDFEETPNCPADAGNHHQITIPNQITSLVRFDTSDFVQYLFPLSGDGKKSTTKLTNQWTKPINNQQSFQIFGDQVGDNIECGFAPNDKIYIRQIQSDNEGARRLTDFTALYAPIAGGNSAQDLFITDGISEVTKLIPKPSVTFGVSGNEKLLNRFSNDYTVVEFNSNLPWAVNILDYFPLGTGGWLSISKLSGSEGPTTITFTTTQDNNSYQPRSALLKFHAVGYENDYFQYMRVVQAGVCSSIDGLTVTSNVPNNTICKGDSITLTASASGGGILYNYFWQNTGQDKRIIKVAPQASGPFTVIVTNPNYCDAFDTRTLFITVKDPPSVAASGGTLSCQNNTVTLNVVTNATSPTYSWQGPNGFTSTLKNPTVSIPGTYFVTVTPSGLAACKGTASTIVIGDVTAPQISTSVNGVLSCTTTSVTISASAPNVANPHFDWSGPSGFTSGQQMPSVSVAGNYVVTVTNQINGCTATASLLVNANTTPPLVSTSVSGKILCTMTPVQISATSNAPNSSFNWSGPFNFSSSSQSPFVINAGTYNVLVTDLNNGCTTQSTVLVESDNSVPNASASGGTVTCANPAVNLVGTSTSNGVSFEWTGPNNFIVLNQPTVSVSTPGIYTFRVIFNANGCSKSVSVTVLEDKTAPGATAVGGVITCSNPSLMLTGSSPAPGGVSWAWAGPNNFTSSQQNPQVSLGGNYVLTITSNTNGCTSSATANVQENKTVPTVGITTPGILTCMQPTIQLDATQSSQGVNYIYIWTTANGNILAGANTLTPSINQTGNYTLHITNTSNGCTNSATTTVSGSLDLPQADAGLPKTLTCTATTVQLSGTASIGAVYKYSWTGPGIIANPTTLTPTVNQPGNYVLMVENMATQCINSDSVIVIQDIAIPAVTLPAPPTITCANNKTVEITATTSDAGIVYEWFAPGNVSIGNSATVVVGSAGIYTLFVQSNITGCFDTKQLTVNVDTLAPTGGAGVDKTICAGDSWILGLGNNPNFQYQWSPLVSNPTAASPITTPAGNQVYFVTITNPANQCTRTDAAEVKVSPGLDVFISIANDLKCHGDTNGNLVVTGAGGTPPLTYEWSNGINTQQNPNLATGIYTATVTDQAGCSQALPSALLEPDEITISSSVSYPSGGNPNSGFISISPSGGVGGYNYQWFLNNEILGGQTQPIIINLSTIAGYTVMVTDANGCVKVFGPFSTIATGEPDWAATNIRLFPNPTSEEVNVLFDLPLARLATIEVWVFDVLGREIQTRKGQIFQRDIWAFDFRAQQAGIYLLKIKINETAPVVRTVSVIR